MKKEVILSYFPNITQHKFNQLCNNFNSWKQIKNLDFKDLKTLGWKNKIIKKFINWKRKVNLQKIKNNLKKENIHCVTKEDTQYPNLLKKIHNPPYCLFVKGQLSPDDFCIGIVGTRTNSKYGKKVTYKLVEKLAEKGVNIVSGLAYGIDSFAHKTTLQAEGKTTAVLGSGNDRKNIYPRDHKDLVDRIVKSGGAVITEYSPGTSPTRYTFPKRNRIISGMSLGTVVVEAGESSGALITANFALEQNREVFAVPQNITSKNAKGPNQLIKEGATPVTSPEDILEEFHFDFHKENKKTQFKSKEEKILLTHLTEGPVDIDNLIKKTHLESSKITNILSTMEKQGKVKKLKNRKYVLSK